MSTSSWVSKILLVAWVIFLGGINAGNCVILTGEDINVSADTVVAAEDRLDYGRINITDSVTLENNGIINSDIHVCAGCDLVLRNSGSFNGRVYLEEGASLTQLIQSASDMHAIKPGVDFSILVSGYADRLSLAQLASMAAGAGAERVILHNALLILDNAEFVRSAMPPIEVRGEIFIHVTDFSIVYDGLLFKNVSGDGKVHVYADYVDPLHAFTAYVSRDNLLVRRVRITDYKRILGDARGDFLNELRKWNPYDPLLARLDMAETMDELYAIMARSVRMNPINMMRPVRMLNATEMNRSYFDINSSHVFASPIFMHADEFDLYGVRAGVAGRVSDSLVLALAGYAAVSEYEDDINLFRATMYGANIAANYDFDIAFIRGVFGATYADFEVGPVFNGHGTTFDPRGRALYGALDIGHRFDFGTDIYVAPFVGVAGETDAVLHQRETNARMRGGVDMGFAIDMDGIRYDYGGRVQYDSDGFITGGVHVAVWSKWDGAGGDVAFDIVEDDIGRAYRVSFGARVQF